MRKRIVKPVLSLTLGATIWASSVGVADAYSYRIQEGDTMWKIAQREQISVESIKQANPHIHPDYMQVGQVIEVPTPDDVYVVTQGETFWSISKKLNIALQPFLDSNPTLIPENIYQGLRLRLPNSQANANSSVLAVDAKGPAPATPQSAVQTVATPAGEQAFSRMLEVRASAYTAAAEENGGWAGLDYMGNKLTLGTIAVDPNVIPLGTKLFVTGYDYKGLPAGGFIGKATDTGGAIKGNRIDIFVPDSRQEALKFGLQDIKVYILE